MIQNFSEISHSSAVLLYDGIVVLEISHSSAVLYDCIVVFDSFVRILYWDCVYNAILCNNYIDYINGIVCDDFGGSSLGCSHGLSAKSGSQRLLVLRTTCCSTLNEASSIKSDWALYIS